MVINHVAKSQKITHLTIWSQVILKDHPKSKDFTQQFFCWGYWNSKETHQNWPIGLIIQHFKCHVLIFPPQISDKKPCKFNNLRNKKPFDTYFFPNLHPIKNIKIPFKTNLLQEWSFFPQKTSDFLKRSRKANLPTKIGSQHRCRTFHRLAISVPRVEIVSFCVVWPWQP